MSRYAICPSPARFITLARAKIPESLWNFRMCPQTGRNQHHGQPPAEIQRQRIFLQSVLVSLYRRRVKRKGQSVTDWSACWDWSGDRGWNVLFFLFQLAIGKYEEMFPAFSDSRECKLLKVCDLFVSLRKLCIESKKGFVFTETSRSPRGTECWSFHRSSKSPIIKNK